MRIELNKRANGAQVLESLRMAGNVGANIYVEWERDCKLKKTVAPHGARVTKRTGAFVRYGVAFENLASVKAGIEAGTRGEVQALPAGRQWKAGYEGTILEITSNLETYEAIRFTGASLNNLPRVTTWFLNGKEVEFADVQPMLLASEYKSDWLLSNVKGEILTDELGRVCSVQADSAQSAILAGEEKYPDMADDIHGAERAPLQAFDVRASNIVAIGRD